jgi:hypothetical protein
VGIDPTTQVVNGLISVAAQLAAPQAIGFISIAFQGPEERAQPSGAPRPLADNAVAYVDQGPYYTDGRNPGEISVTVTLIHPDGSSMWAIETNSSEEKAPAKPGTPLPLTADQVVTLLDDPAWAPVIAAADSLGARPLT